MGDFKDAVEKTIIVADQLYRVVNGDPYAQIQLEDGSIISSLKGLLASSFQFKDPIPWQTGSTETEYNQIRSYTDNSWWIAPSASPTNPVTMGLNPATDVLWTPVSYNRIVDSQKAVKNFLARLIAETGYTLVQGSFQEGATFANSSDVVIDYGDNPKIYKFIGTLPHTIAPRTLPSSSVNFAEVTDLHSTSNNAHTVNQIVGLQQRLSNLEVDKVKVIVGTSGDAAAAGFNINNETVPSGAPTTVQNNSYYVFTNPFGNNIPVCVEVLLEVSTGNWISAEWSWDSGGYGVSGFYIKGIGIVIQTGTTALIRSTSFNGTSSNITNTKYAVIIRKVEV